MKLLNDIIAVKRRKANTLIDLPDHKEHIGEVVGVGPGTWLKRGGKDYFLAMTLSVGDHVMFSHRAGMEREINGEQLLFMHEKDVLCVVDPEEIKVTDNAADEKRVTVGKIDKNGLKAVS